MSNEFKVSNKMQMDIEDAIHSGFENKLYPKLVTYFIRQKYKTNDEFALLRQYDTKQYEFDEYYNYCERAKKEAKKLLGLE